jgi:hypothetical protein
MTIGDSRGARIDTGDQASVEVDAVHNSVPGEHRSELAVDVEACSRRPAFPIEHRDGSRPSYGCRPRG